MPADSLKQRLVGACALLLLGAIAWFTLLSTDNPVDPMARATQIPTAPDIKPFTVPEPTAPKDVEPIGSEHDSKPVARTMAAVQSLPKAEPAPVARPEPRAVAPRQAEPLPAGPKREPAATKAVEKPAAKAVASADKAPAKPAAKAVEPTSVSSKQASPKPEPTAPAKPAQTFELDQHGLPVAWVVQVGSFATQANADKIKQALQEKGFKAYAETVKTAKGSAIKVYVGPKLSRERADAQRKAIDQALKINSMVVRFPVG